MSQMIPRNPWGDPCWGTTVLQARAGKVVRLRGVAAAPQDFCTESRQRDPAEEGVGGGGKPPPPEGVLNTPTQRSTDLGSVWDHFGISLASFLIIFASFWDHFGITLGSFWDRFRIILGSFWDRFCILLGSLLYRLGIVLGSCWDRFGIVLGSFWDRFGIVLGSLWDHFGDILVTFNSGLQDYRLI